MSAPVNHEALICAVNMLLGNLLHAPTKHGFVIVYVPVEDGVPTREPIALSNADGVENMTRLLEHATALLKERPENMMEHTIKPEDAYDA